MDIEFTSAKLAKLCNNLRDGKKKWGSERFRLVRKRLDDLAAAEVLEDVRNLPGKCEEYRHLKNHTFTMRLDGAWRLYFRPSHNPIPVLADGTSTDWTKVTSIEILKVEKAHD